MIATGYLRIEVYNEQMQPVAGAIVRIYRGEHCVDPIASMRTNAQGRCEEIALEAPHASLTMQSTTIRRPYATYSIEVTCTGYDIEVVHNVQVFADNGSTLPIQLKESKGNVPQRHVNDLGEHKLYTDGTGSYYA